jgi:hypothetical protein
MKFLVALNSLGIGGTESYVLTVAEHLDRLAHDVLLYAPEPGPGAAVARERGIAVATSGELGDAHDVALVQDAAVSFEVAGLLPQTPQIFVGHSENFEPQAPPQLPDLANVAVALNDRVAGRIRAFAVEREVVRLRQPIDTERFLSRGPLPEVPRRALILSNNHLSDRQGMLESACEEVGIELIRLGGAAGQSNDPRAAMAEADIVIGYGRSILEAMALGRAAYVYDWAGGDGWVTAESYPAIEANGFAGRREPIVDRERLVRDLRAYSSAMGPVNRDLISAHHRANVHTQELVELARRTADPPGEQRAPLDEMARLVRQEWRARAEVHGLLGELAGLRRRVAELEGRLTETEALRGEAVEAARAAAVRIEEVAGVRGEYEKTLSWRLTAPLRRLRRR